MLKFKEYLKVNGKDNLVHEYQEDTPPYTDKDYYYTYGEEYQRYVTACIADERHEKL